MKRVVYVGPAEGAEAAQEVIGDRCQLSHVPAEPARVAEALSGSYALIDASMKVRITDAMVRAAPNLRVISTATTGSDHIERGETGVRGIPVRTLKEDPELLRNLTPAAELTWALVMALARRLVPAVAHTRAGQWVREDFPGMMLNGRTLGVIGCGRIGQWMSRYARAFGMTVVGFDPVVSPWPEGIEPATLDEVASRADVLSVHVHLSETTRGLVSRDLIARMKPGAIFVNTSRGAVADERALAEAVSTGRLGGVGVDVLEGEPEIEGNPLLALSRTQDNVLITPHCGGYSPDAVRVVCGRAAEKVLAELERAR